jgi:hypothetical protein
MMTALQMMRVQEGEFSGTREVRSSSYTLFLPVVVVVAVAVVVVHYSSSE